MKRFLVFEFCGYYPSGGWGDFRKDFDDLDEARKYVASNCTLDYYQIVDAECNDEVQYGEPKDLKKELEQELEQQKTNDEFEEDKDIRFTDDDPWGVS